MIFAAHEDDRPVATGPVAEGVPTPRPPLDDAASVDALPVDALPVDALPVDALPVDATQPPVASLDTTPSSASRVGVVGVDRGSHLDRVAAEVAASATAVTWALCLVLLGLTGLVVVLLTVL